MSVQTCFIGTQSLHTEDASIRPRSRKRELRDFLLSLMALANPMRSRLPRLSRRAVERAVEPAGTAHGWSHVQEIPGTRSSARDCSHAR
jgi:hypothetical protein